ncbi:hypothetical protein BGX23_012303 [Mortierella sp. AD031]|nr:hypothetical protein BGX23_012303 [Mortierella sp. AD031]
MVQQDSLSDEHVQSVRRVYENDDSTDEKSSSSSVYHLTSHPDPSVEKDILLWDDVLAAFKDVVHVRSGTKILPFLKGPDFKNARSDVVLPNETPELTSQDQRESLETSEDTVVVDNADATVTAATTTSSPRRSPAYGLEEEAIGNYAHIDNPATAPNSRAPQSPSDDKKPTNNSAEPQLSSNNAKQQPPQYHDAIGAKDVMRTRINASFGDKDAQVTLGDLYMDGQGVPKDYHAAKDWYHRAANQGDAEGQYKLGRLYEQGQGVSQSYRDAMGWRSADNGHADAQYRLGLIYEYGHCRPRSYSDAMTWYRKAADQGHAPTQYRLGLLYERGQSGVSQDYPQAMEWYRKAADQGHTTAQFSIGSLYEYGRGVPQDYSQMLHWFRKAADQGDAKAQLNVGALYRIGQGVPQDYSQALHWFQKAADKEVAGALFCIGQMHEQGHGVPQDLAQALGWYFKAAEQGFESAQHEIAVRAVNKDHRPTTGTPADPDEIFYIDCQIDPATNKEFVLWDDILQAFEGALHARHKARMLHFLKDSEFRM